jgi:hypothetical protein
MLVLASAYAVGGIFMKKSDGRGPVAAFVVLFASGSLLQALGMGSADLSVSYIIVLGVDAVLSRSCSARFAARAPDAGARGGRRPRRRRRPCSAGRRRSHGPPGGQRHV